MAFLTQAGVTLGLAQQAGAHFPWGPDFNATIVAVSVINQVVGPPMMKYALRAAGEAHHNYVPQKYDEVSGVGSIGAIGKANLPLTGRPQPRGVLVIGQDALDLHRYETRTHHTVLHAHSPLCVCALFSLPCVHCVCYR